MTTLGSGSNAIVPHATGAGANVESSSAWNSDTVRQQGFQSGILPSVKLNTPIRQATFIAAMIGQFMADFSGAATADDGNVVGAEANFIAALNRQLQPLGVLYFVDSGSANAVVGTPSPALSAYVAPSLVIFKKMSAPNTGAMTINLNGLGSVALVDNTGAALSSGAVLGNSLYVASFDGGQYRLLGGAATYTSVSTLTANSGDMVAVDTGGVVNFRTARGTHSAAVNSGDKWPRGDASDDHGKYMTTSEFLSWLNTAITFPSSGPNTEGTDIGAVIYIGFNAGQLSGSNTPVGSSFTASSLRDGSWAAPYGSTGNYPTSGYYGNDVRWSSLTGVWQCTQANYIDATGGFGAVYHNNLAKFTRIS